MEINMMKHNYNKKLDIPQDADSARYFIPEEYIAKFEDGVLIVEPKSEDERIRRWLIDQIKAIYDFESPLVNKAIAWLEKQKEQKPFPKFKVGDTIHCKYDDREFTIKSVDLTNMVYKYTKEGCGNDIDYADEDFELVEQKPAECLKAERDGWYMCIKDYYRGGKKQCSVGDLVQAKGGMYMMDGEDISEWFRKAYYDEIKTVEWNKATINGEPIPTENHSVNIPLAVWSEEDERMLHEADIAVVGYYRHSPKYFPKDKCKHIRSWLKSLRPPQYCENCKLKHSVEGWKPSEEQLRALQVVVDDHWDVDGDALYSLYTDLKELI